MSKFLIGLMLLNFLCCSTEASVLRVTETYTLAINYDGFIPSQDQLRQIEDFFHRTALKYPRFIKSIELQKYNRLVFKKTENAEKAAEVWPGAPWEGPAIRIFESFFDLVEKNYFSETNFVSTFDLILMHELHHAFDQGSHIAFGNLERFGWQNQTNNFEGVGVSYRETKWITHKEFKDVLKEFNTHLRAGDKVGAYKSALGKIRRYSYPSLYCVYGGPVECFAETGAFIAVDPQAADYVPQATIDWYDRNVLN